MTSQHAENRRKPETATGISGGKKRIKDFAQMGRGNARTVIYEFYDSIRAFFERKTEITGFIAVERALTRQY